MTTHDYHDTQYRTFQGHETRQVGIDGAAYDDAWYWEPAEYEGDTLWSNRYETEEDAKVEAELAYDNGDWS